MDFKKYNSIENTARTKTMNQLVEEGLVDGEWSVTEKVHGANLSFWITSTEIRVAKRSGFLGVGAKFFNFNEVFEDHLERLKFLFIIMSEVLEVKDDSLGIILYGELFGGTYPHDDVESIPGTTTVQRGVYYYPMNNFYAFDMKVNGRFINTDVFEEIMEELGFFYAKSLFKGTLEEALEYPNEFQTTIPQRLGLPEIENNTCEGVVIKPINVQYFSCGSRVILKNKNEKFSEISHKKDKGVKVPEDYTLEDNEEEIYQVALTYMTENRLRNVISHIGEITDKMFGQLQGRFMADIMKDFRIDHVEKLESLDKKRVKLIQRKLNRSVVEMVRSHFLDIIDGTF